MFDRYVKSPLLVKNFETLCNRWRKLSVGALSPNFNCTDLSGKKVSLSDFKGKYVYIDIWATWCGPCQREIPHLQKLEEKYHGKDIYFVSISCDNNKKAWENRVRAGLKGIQLHFVNERAAENISEEERKYEFLWKRFFHSISIKERENPKCQQAHLPFRYRGEMTEFSCAEDKIGL